MNNEMKRSPLRRLLDFMKDPFGIKRIKKLTEDLLATNVLVEILKEEAEDANKVARNTRLELTRQSRALTMYKAQSVINRQIDKISGEKRHFDHMELKTLYEAVAQDIDPDGLILFQTAQDILGKFDETNFPYEANLGFFEGAILSERGSFQALLVQYADKLGQPKNPNRWEIVQCGGGYERCADWSIDKTTPEYIEFEGKLYTQVFKFFYDEAVPFVLNEAQKKDASLWDAGPLYNADPPCKHQIVPVQSGGVRCAKCGGWFAY